MTRGKRLLLLRHAQAQLAPGQREGDLFSVADAPLSPHGRAQAEAARERLRAEPVDAIFASGRRRARETAEILGAPRGLPVKILPALDEMPVGRNEDGYEAVLAAILDLPRRLELEGDPRLDDGRLWSEVTDAFAAAVDEALSASSAPLIVSHGLSIRAYLARLLHMPPAAFLLLGQDHAAINVVEQIRGHAIVQRVNAPPL